MSKARQLKTLVAYVLKHEIVFASGSPRISQFEVEVLNKAGYLMQSEQGLHTPHSTFKHSLNRL